MKRRVLAFLLLFITATTVYAELRDYSLTRSDGSNLHYYLSAGTKPNTDTLLLILQGSDCNSVTRIDSIFTDYRNVWPEADLLLVEKYGIDRQLSYSSAGERQDCPQAYLKGDSPRQRVADIRQVLDKVINNGRYPQLIVLGGSEGAVIANLLASEREVSASIAFNGGGRWFKDDVLHSIQLESPNPEVAREALAGFEGFSQHILNSPPTDLIVSGHAYDWWQQMLSLDQQAVLQQIESPVLLIQSGQDRSVSPQKQAQLVNELKAAGKDNIHYLTYGALDHQFNKADGSSDRKRVVADIRQWLTKILAP